MLEREGCIRVAGADGQLRPTPFLDLTGEVSTSTEEGLLGLAFHPRFRHNGYVYVDYTANDWSVQCPLHRGARPPDMVDPGTAHRARVPKQSKYHNGGMLAFGPDGYLYVAIGDDEASDTAQDLGKIVGKILRIDVDSAEPYAIPPSNPSRERARRARRDLVVRLAQPVALQLRSRHWRPVDRRRRRREVRRRSISSRPASGAAKITAGR